MLVYFGRRFSVAMEGSRWKPVACERCGAEWAYQVQVRTVGTGHSAYMLDNQGAQARAHYGARDQLMRTLDATTRVLPCPACGFYQADMVRKWRGQQGGTQMGLAALALSLGGIAGLLAALSGLFALIVGTTLIGGVATIVSAVIAAALIAGGVASLKWRGQVQRAFDPNLAAEVLARKPPPPQDAVIRREEYEQLAAECAQSGQPLPIQGIDWPRPLAPASGIARVE